MKRTLLVLAAGMGSRYGGLKQLDSVGPDGETIIDYSVYDAIRAGFEKLVFIIRRDIEEAFKSAVGSKYSDRIEIDYAYQELDALPDGFSVPADRKKPWGTGHAILMAKDVIDGPFAVINSDDFYGRESFAIAADFLGSDDCTPSRYAMVGFKLSNTLSDHGSVARGICNLDANEELQSLTETLNIREENGAITSDTGDLTGSEIVSMNMWAFPNSIFEHLESQFTDFLKESATVQGSEFFIPSAVNKLMNDGDVQVRILKTPAPWFGVTYKEDKPMVEKSIAGLTDSGVYPNPLWG